MNHSKIKKIKMRKLGLKSFDVNIVVKDQQNGYYSTQVMTFDICIIFLGKTKSNKI